MRVIFMGTPEFAVPSLESVLAAGHEVPLVVSTPDRHKGRGMKSAPSAVKACALEHGLPVAVPESLKDEAFIRQVSDARPDVICVVAFRILPEAVYGIPSRGSFNLHGSLLPKYRGAAPINWAIINGEKETGVTTFFLRRKVDTGAVILRRRIPIGAETTAGELHDAMMVVGAEAVADTLRMIEQGTAVPMPQDDTLASGAPKIFRDDCRIDWNQSAERVHDFIRGLSPYPGAFTMHGERLLKIYRSRIGDRPALPAGAVVVDGEAILVGTASAPLEITELQQEGRRAMGAAEFLRGFRFDDGGTLA